MDDDGSNSKEAAARSSTTEGVSTNNYHRSLTTVPSRLWLGVVPTPATPFFTTRLTILAIQKVCLPVNHRDGVHPMHLMS